MNAPLIYLLGGSGSGKDSLLLFARHRLAGHPRIQFAHRYITRAPDAGGENHVHLHPAEFEQRQAQQLLFLAWRSHGLDYGVGLEVREWLERGQTVIMNGSRGYLAEANTRCPTLLPVWVEVSEPVLRQRLQARGRETPAQIEDRLRRHREWLAQPRPGLVLQNDGPLEEAGERLVRLIGECAGGVRCE